MPPESCHGVLALESGEAYGAERLFDGLSAFTLAHGFAPQWEVNVCRDSQPREKRAAVVLEHKRHAFRRGCDTLVIELDGATRRWEQPGHCFEQRRLAAAGRSDDAHELARIDVKRNVADRLCGLFTGPVCLAEVRNLEHRCVPFRQS
jgi:hypothetical protein